MDFGHVLPLWVLQVFEPLNQVLQHSDDPEVFEFVWQDNANGMLSSQPDMHTQSAKPDWNLDEPDSNVRIGHWEHKRCFLGFLGGEGEEAELSDPRKERGTYRIIPEQEPADLAELFMRRAGEHPSRKILAQVCLKAVACVG
jgi:hypothetical protein